MSRDGSPNLAILRIQLDTLGFFTEFSPEEKDYLCTQPSLFEVYSKGDTLLEEGDPEKDFFVLLDGVLSVHKEGNSGSIAQLSPGAVFGEIAFFSRKRRTTTIRADERTIVLRIPEGYFHELECPLQKNLMYKMVELLVTRLEKMNEVMLRIQEMKARAAHSKR